MKASFKTLFAMLLAASLISCEKTVEKDPVTQPVTAATVASRLVGTWRGKYLEQENYVNNVMTGKSVITSTRNAIEFRKDSTYTSVFEVQAPESGTWEMVSDSYFRFDKGRLTDRYYHIITLDDKNFVYRGPFDAAGNVKFNYLITSYSFKQ